MKINKHLLLLSTVILLCGCNDNSSLTTTSSLIIDENTYINRKNSDNYGVKVEGIETLKIENGTFNYVKSDVSIYSEEAAKDRNINGAYTVSTEANYSGTVTMEKSEGGADVYVLSYESYTYKYIVTGEGATQAKLAEKTILTNVFGAQEAIDLLNDKTITSYYGGKYKAILNEEDKTFTITISWELY